MATLNGSAAGQIVGFARRTDVDLIVMSSHGKHGVRSWNVSGVTEKVALRACRSLLIVRAGALSPQGRGLALYRRILVPLDGSPRAEYVLATAISLARAHDAALVLAHVVREPERPYYLWPDERDRGLVEQLVASRRRVAEEYLDGLCARLPVQAEAELVTGSDAHGTLEGLAKRRGCDLIIMSAHGHSGSPRRAYGGVATGLIGYGTVPLLVVQDLAENEFAPLGAELAIREQQGH